MPTFPSGTGNKGFSIIELLIFVGIAGGLSLVVGTLVKTATQSQKTIQAQDDARVLTQDMAALLANSVACANTFAGAAGSPNEFPSDPVDGSGTSVNNIVDNKLNARYQVGKIYGSRGLKLMGITIGGSGVDAKSKNQKWVPDAGSNTGLTLVLVNWLQTGSVGNQGTGPTNLYRYFTVFVSNLSPGNSIVNCTAQAGAAEGYWTLNTINNIYNNNDGGAGFVGVNTKDPGVSLDVNGAIRPGSETAVTSCGAGIANGEGSKRYNYTTHHMEYCNGTAWVAPTSTIIATDRITDGAVVPVPAGFSMSSCNLIVTQEDGHIAGPGLSYYSYDASVGDNAHWGDNHWGGSQAYYGPDWTVSCKVFFTNHASMNTGNYGYDDPGSVNPWPTSGSCRYFAVCTQ